MERWREGEGERGKEGRREKEKKGKIRIARANQREAIHLLGETEILS